MSAAFVHALHGEWLKQRRSLASWLVVTGALFTPAIIVAARFIAGRDLARVYAAPDFWMTLWRNSWESAAIFFLPMGAVLATSLIAQIEFRNHAWKQVHALPLSVATIWFAKLAIVLGMLVQFFVLFNVAIALSAIVPWCIVDGVPFPAGPIPWAAFWRDDVAYFVGALPIVALQFGLAMLFRNAMVPIGVGFLLWVGTLAALPWRFVYVVPYAYPMLAFLRGEATHKAAVPAFDLVPFALAWFVVLTAVGFAVFAMRREKG